MRAIAVVVDAPHSLFVTCESLNALLRLVEIPDFDRLVMRTGCELGVELWVHCDRIHRVGML